MSPEEFAAKEALHKQLLARRPATPPGVDQFKWDWMETGIVQSLRAEPDLRWLAIEIAAGLGSGFPEPEVEALYKWLVDLRPTHPAYGADWAPAPPWERVMAKVRLIREGDEAPESGEVGGTGGGRGRR